ncbi:MAG: hypothetical protein QM479_05785 [Pseudomonadota bacterium]
MIKFNQTAIRLYLKLFGSPEQAGQLAYGIETVLDGNTAIAVTEACITEVAVLGGGFSEPLAALAWLSEQQRVSSNLFDQKLSVQHADSPRGALAIAMGITMSGHRSTVFLNAQDLASCQDLLHLAVGRQLALVIHLDNQLLGSQGNNSSSGHEVLHQIMDSGCMVLFAANVQQAVDFSLIARQVAELSLKPVIVVMDGAETALSVQDVRLPSRELVLQFIGAANEKISSPSIAQKQLFLESRCRLQSWFDLDTPVLQGAMLDAEIAALGHSARQVYFDPLVQQQFEKSTKIYAKLTGRNYQSVSGFGLKKADIIFIAQGSAIETLKSLSNYLLAAEKIQLGVIALHSLRPFDSELLIKLLAKAKDVIVLDRSDLPLADDAPLIREIRASIQKNNQLKQSQPIQPYLHSIIYGLGGTALNIADLVQLCLQLKALNKSHNGLAGRYLGIHFNSEKNTSNHPKYQVMLDVLLRYYPQISELGINAKDKTLDLFSHPSNKNVEKPLNLALSHLGENTNYASIMDLAGFLHSLTGNYIRSIIGSPWQQWRTRQIDYLQQSAQAYALGSSALVDYFIVIEADIGSLLSACHNLNSYGSLLFSSTSRLYKKLSATELSQWLSCLDLIKTKKLGLYQVELDQSETAYLAEQQSWEKICGILLALLKENHNLNLKSRKIVAIRQSYLATLLAGHSSQQNADQEAVLADVFKQAMENCSALDRPSLLLNTSRITSNKQSQQITAKKIDNFAQVADGYDSLPRFCDQLDSLSTLQSGQATALCADPFLASAIVPPLTASFNDLSQISTQAIPVFNAVDCTACGACWANCPDSAIATIAISPKALIDSAINNTGADALRSVTPRLAAQIAKQCRTQAVTDAEESKQKPGTAGELLSAAFDWLKEKAGFDAQRMQAISADFNKVLIAIADFPIVISDGFFYSQEKQQNGSGELFSLVINPQSCKSCGLCIALCETQALAYKQTAEQTDPVLLWEMWQQTPDTLSTTIERINQQQLMPTGAALMLSRYHAFALSGGDLAEPASGEKIALRQILAGVEYHQQPLLFRFIKELEQLRAQLKEEISANLAQALPTENLNLLAAKLSDIKTRQVDLNELLESPEQLMENTAIDAVKVRQLVDYVLQLNDLLYKLSTGSYGLGRARYSLCITSPSISSWAGSFPNNPFQVPVNIDMTGESAQIATGLVQGQINDLLVAISLKRKVQASLNPRATTNNKTASKTQLLDWSDLTQEEQQLCPPLLLVGGDEILAGQGLAQISLLLNLNYPIKIIIFTELDSGLVASRHIDSANNLALMAMSQRNAYVAQSSIADNSHLQSCVHDMLNANAATVLRIHTPSPSKHGFKTEWCIQQAELAVKTRMFPLFSYNPEREGVFGSRLSLVGNPQIDQDWSSKEEGDLFTPANWAINEKRFQAHFSALSDKALLPTEISSWVKLSDADKQKKTPYFVNASADKITISKEFATMLNQQQHLWRCLQELAGIVTPFTDLVEQKVQQRVAAEHQQQLDSLRAEYEEKLKLLEANYNNQTHTKIRNQLLGIAGYDVSHLQ